MTAMLDWVLFGVGCLIAMGLVYGYFGNIWKLIQSLRSSDYSFKLALRGVGVFFPIVGVIMGFV